MLSARSNVKPATPRYLQRRRVPCVRSSRPSTTARSTSGAPTLRSSLMRSQGRLAGRADRAGVRRLRPGPGRTASASVPGRPTLPAPGLWPSCRRPSPAASERTPVLGQWTQQFGGHRQRQGRGRTTGRRPGEPAHAYEVRADDASQMRTLITVVAGRCSAHGRRPSGRYGAPNLPLGDDDGHALADEFPRRAIAVGVQLDAGVAVHAASEFAHLRERSLGSWRRKRSALVAFEALRRWLRCRTVHPQVRNLAHPAREVGLQVFRRSDGA